MNIFGKLPEGLSSFRDERGSITDIFYGRNINHVNIISSVPGVIRGNHYHAHTIQHVLILEGSLDYWYMEPGSLDSRMISLFKGDVVTSQPGEVHAMKIGPSGCLFMSFSEGPRGGKDYESDTYRVRSIITE